MKAWMWMAAVAPLIGSAGYAGPERAGAEARSLDSGRYGVEAECGLVFDGNAAQGPKQTVAIQLDPAAVGQGPSLLARVRFAVEVKEGRHVVQRYSFVVPVSAK